MVLELNVKQRISKGIVQTNYYEIWKTKLYSSFKYHVWGADLTDMQLLSKYSKEIRFLLTVIDIYSKYAWAASLKVKKGITITSAFQKICMSLIANQKKHG